MAGTENPDIRTVPGWVFRALPANAVVDPDLMRRVEEAADAAIDPRTLDRLSRALAESKPFAEYDAAANRAAAIIWGKLSSLLRSPDPYTRRALLEFAVAHLAPRPAARIIRRLANDPVAIVRNAVARILEDRPPREVSLPGTPDGDWDATGWLPPTEARSLSRHRHGARVQKSQGVPALATVGALRKLLGIRSTNQLGWFLLATDADGGPYTRFTVSKNGAVGTAGAVREIHAPRGGLMHVQRRILDLVLADIPVHDAAHGFVIGRSTVTNAAGHVGADLLMKFDLTDFFPTIHYFRVVGLFASLGYGVGTVRFSSDDDSPAVAPTLARLCCHTPDKKRPGLGRLPQGAPTSPAISNIVCRRLDARLHGIAQRWSGTYTRYADDLTFSFRGPAAEALSAGRFRWWVDQICHQEGFLVNQSKFRVIRKPRRQLVTGLVVNERLAVPREDRRRFRAILKACERNGVDSQARGRDRFRDWLRGFAAYIHMVHPDDGRELLQRVERVLAAAPDGSEPPAEGTP